MAKQLTEKDQNTLVELKEIQDNKLFPILFKQDSKELMDTVIEINHLISKTLEKFKD